MTISGGDRDQIESRARQAAKPNVRRPGRTLASMGHFTDVDDGAALATIRSLFVILYREEHRLPPFEPVAQQVESLRSGRRERWEALSDPKQNRARLMGDVYWGTKQVYLSSSD